MPAIVNVFNWVLGELPQDHLIRFMKEPCWVLFGAEAMVMNGRPGRCDCRCGEHHSSSPQPSHRLHGDAGWELSPASCDGCEGCGTVCHGKRSWGRKIIPRIKPVILQKSWPHWAEARLGKAPCVVSSARTCCHDLCPQGFLCFTGSVPSECHAAALGCRLACRSSLCLSCREDFCCHRGECLAAGRFSCTNESCLSHLSPCQEQPAFSQGIEQPSWLT